MFPFEAFSSINVLGCLKTASGEVHLSTRFPYPLPFATAVEIAGLRMVLVLVNVLPEQTFGLREVFRRCARWSS